MEHEKYRAAPLNILGSGRRERKLGVVRPVGETHKQLSQRRGSVRAETSDAADPGGARVCRGGRRSHPQQHPPRLFYPREFRELPLCNYHGPTYGQPPTGSLRSSVPAAESSGCLARAPRGREARGHGERPAGLEAQGRNACLRGPAAVPSALRIPQVMGTRARPGSRRCRTAPSFAPSARSHPGTPPAPRASPLELLPLPWLPWLPLPLPPPPVASC